MSYYHFSLVQKSLDLFEVQGLRIDGLIKCIH
jgi:hypothetical protein